MKLLILTRYSQRGASSRIRFYQYEPYFQQFGIETTYVNLFDDYYLQLRYKEINDKYRLRLTLHTIQRMLQRLKQLLQKPSYDIVYIEYELLPYIPTLFERILLKKFSPFIVDYDDGKHIQYRHHRNPVVRLLSSTKIEHIMSLADGITVANTALATYARQYNSNVWFIPDGIDLKRYGKPKEHKPCDDACTIGWIGTSFTSHYLMNIADALQTVAQQTNACLKIVGHPEFSLEGCKVEAIPWSLDNEVELLKTFDIGIMPLDNTPFSQGKSGYKLLQYMGVGLPVVASPVGFNQNIVQHGQNGYLATSTDEWVFALLDLIQHTDKRVDFGMTGYQTIQQNYSTDVLAPQLIDVLNK